MHGFCWGNQTADDRSKINGGINVCQFKERFHHAARLYSKTTEEFVNEEEELESSRQSISKVKPYKACILPAKREELE